MANITFPRTAMSSFAYGIVTPGQSVSPSPITGDTLVLARGQAFWRGTFTWGPFGRSKERANINEVLAFLADMGGQEHTFDIPIPDTDQAGRFAGAVTLTDWQRSGVKNQLQLSVNADAATGVGLLAGDLLTINYRLYQCVTDQAGDQVVVTPGKVDAAVGAAVEWETPTVRARSAMEGTPTITYDGDFVEPIRTEWRQAYV